MYNKTSFINETDYAEVSGTRWIMRDLPNYAEGHQFMRKIMRAHNRIIQRSLTYTSPPLRRLRAEKLQIIISVLSANMMLENL